MSLRFKERSPHLFSSIFIASTHYTRCFNIVRYEVGGPFRLQKINRKRGETFSLFSRKLIFRARGGTHCGRLDSVNFLKMFYQCSTVLKFLTFQAKMKGIVGLLEK